MTEPRRRRALITRPQEDAADVAVALARRGITPVLAPMMQIVHLPGDPADMAADARLAQAILFTSRNGVRAFCRLDSRRDVPAFAVGDSTAALARDSGFATVHSAGGDSSDLARLVGTALRPEDGPLFHPAGETVAGNLSGELSAAGFRVLRRVLYRAEPISELPADIVTALQKAALDYVLFFSPRTAQIFTDRVAASGLGGSTARLTALCLSPAVAETLDPERWLSVATADEPTTDALLRLLDRREPGDTSIAALAAAVTRAAAENGGAGTTSETPSVRSSGRVPESSQETPPGLPADKPVEPATESRDKSGNAPPAVLPAAAGHEPRRAGPWQQAAPEGTDVPPAESVPSEPGTAESRTAESAPAEMPVQGSGAHGDAGGNAGEDNQGGSMTDRDKPADGTATAERASGGGAEPLPGFLSGTVGATSARRRSRSAAIGWTLAATLAVLVAAYLSLPLWQDRLPESLRARLAGGDTGAVAALRSEIAAARSSADEAAAALAEIRRRERDLDARVGELAARLAAGDGLPSRLAGVEAAIAEMREARPADPSAPMDALDERLARLEGALETALAARAEAVRDADESQRQRVEQAERTVDLVARMEDRIASLENQVRSARRAMAVAGQADSLALAVVQLRTALAGPSPFGAELAILRKVAGDDAGIAEAIEPVVPFAGTGIPTKAALFTRLPDVVAAAVEAGRPAGDPGLAGRVMSRLREFVTVRRIDGRGTGDEARIARAEIAAARDDLAATAAELSGLEGAAAEAVAPWLADARARLAATAAAAGLDRVLLAAVTGGEPGAVTGGQPGGAAGGAPGGRPDGAAQ